MTERVSIEDLLKFLNRCSIEPALIWVLPHLYDKKAQYEVQWSFSKSAEENFHIRKVGEATWTQLSAEELVKILSIEKVDLAHLEFQLLRTICVQAVCSHYYIERASELIGRDRVMAAIKIISEFSPSSLNPPPPSPPPPPQNSPNPPHLSLVKKKKQKSNKASKSKSSKSKPKK
jgi:hypothetical protein